MGEPVTVIEQESSRHGYVRFETNRSFTGMGHESYRAGDTIHRDRPPDDVARALFASDKVDEVHVYAQTITVKLQDGEDSSGLAKIIEDIYIHYLPGVEVPTPEMFATEG
ncbi:MAG: hypothetical protein AAGA93_17635 [Actinomycetota bacterium]